MEDMSKKNHNIKLSGDSDSHKNETEERAIKIMVTIMMTITMHAVQVYPKLKLLNDFGQ